MATAEDIKAYRTYSVRPVCLKRPFRFHSVVCYTSSWMSLNFPLAFRSLPFSCVSFAVLHLLFRVTLDIFSLETQFGLKELAQLI